jgi:antitoxin component YwqK of YwqJK toxin-antitoxin module
MIIYGTGERKITSPAQYVKCKCPECGEFEITFHFFKKFFHLFWIPVFPIGSRKLAYCEKCHAGYQESIPTSLTMEMENAKSRTSTPIYLFSGSFLLVIGLSALFYFNDGTTTHYYPSKQKQAMGKYVNEKPDGKWTYWFENGKLQSEQYYKEGIEDSVWTWYSETGEKTKSGGYRNGLYHGKWLFYFPSGVLQEEVVFVENRKHGKSIVYYESGKKAIEGMFVRDRESDKWTYWYENGNKMMEGAFNTGIKSGRNIILKTENSAVKPMIGILCHI